MLSLKHKICNEDPVILLRIKSQIINLSPKHKTYMPCTENIKPVTEN